MAERQLKIELDLDSKGFTAKIVDASGATAKLDANLTHLAKTVDKVEKRANGMLGKMRDFTVILSQVRTAIYNVRVLMTGWAEAIIKTNIEVERMGFLLAGMSKELTAVGRNQDAIENLDMLINKARSAPFALDALTDSFVKMKSVGIDPTNGSMDALTDAVAAFGGNDQILKRASIAIQQMGGKGVVSMEELRQQLGEAVPTAIVLMARSMDLTMKQLVDRISKGQVEASSALGKMFDEMDRVFGGASERLINSFSGGIARLRTAFLDLSLAAGGFKRDTEEMGDGFYKAGSLMDTLKTNLQDFIVALQTPEARMFAVKVGDGLRDLMNLLGDTTRFAVKYGDAFKVLLKILGGFVIFKTVRYAFRNLTAAYAAGSSVVGGLTMRMTALRNAFTLATTQTIATANGVKTFKNASVAAGLAARNLGKAVSGMLGPIGLAISVIASYTNGFGLLTNEIKDADDALRRFNEGLITANSLKALSDGIDEAREKIGKLRHEQKLAASGATTPSGSPLATFTEKDQKQLDELLEKVEKYNTAIAGGTLLLNKQNAEAAAEQAIRIFEAKRADLNAAFSQDMREIDKRREDAANNEALSEAEKTAKQEEITADRLKIVEGYYAKLAEMARVQSDIAQFELANATDINGDPLKGIDEAELARLKKIAEEWQVYLAEIDKARTDAMKRAEDPSKYLAGNGDGDEETALSKFEQRLASLKSRTADLNAELSGTGTEVAKIQSLIDSGTFDTDGVGLTPEQIQSLLDAAKAYDDAGTAVSNMKNDDRIIARLNDEFDRATSYAKEFSYVLAGTKTIADTDMEAFRIRIQQIADGLSETSTEANALTESIIDAYRRGSDGEFVAGLQEKTKAIRNGLLRERDQRVANFELEKAQIYASIDFERYKGEERKRVESAVSDYIAARRAELARANETHLQKMLRDWEDTTQAMDQAQANWLDDFVNSLAEGELKFGAFAKAILADIAKIMLRAAIANAIVSAMGYFGGGGSAHASNSVDPGSLSNTNTMGQFHSGGIVGQKRMMRSMDNLGSVFKNAIKYHTGGIAGLKPNEVPAILEAGEMVLTKDQQRALGNRSAPGVVVNITNQGGERMREKSRDMKFDGRNYVVDIVTEAMSKPGPLRNATKDAARN